MTEKKAYPLRISSEVLDSMQRWAQDDLRSLNAQIEYVLREALRKAGRLKATERDEDELRRPREGGDPSGTGSPPTRG